ncbi:uncharacterized protein [Littorina saxatilis]|uniref:Uncharacterized protein n=1 Tax=Littorina saxatilis TaxID=31220 RepID=A0AAN9BXN7_9CAEN
MNDNALTYHNKLIEWYANKQLHNTPIPQHVLHKPHRSDLSADKHQSIGKWCDDVNRLFIDPPKKEPKQLFRKCKYSDAMFPPNKSTVRSHSASPSKQLWSSPGKRNPVKSVVLTGQPGVKHQPSHVRDRRLDDEKHTALAAKMADNTNHYAQERKIVHLNIHPDWKRKLSTGWTINRPLLYPKVPPPPPPDNLLVDIPDYLVRNEDNKMEVCSLQGPPKRKSSSNGSDNSETAHVASRRPSELKRLSIQKDVSDELKDSKEDDAGNDFKNKGTQCEPDTDRKPSTNEEETETPRSRNRPIVSARSSSNGILNVLSVDDCKMIMRHRPVRVIDTHDTMFLPPPKLSVHKESREDGCDDDVIPEEDEDVGSNDVTTTQNTPIRLSQGRGSARTTLTPSQVNSRVNAYREMYDTYSKMTPEAKVTRPSSAAVQKAFDVLLDKKFQAVQSSRRPLSSPSKLLQPRPSSRTGSHASSPGSAPSLRFQQLNNTLRQQMYDYLDTHWFHTKLRFQRTKNGYTRSAMKKGRMITSSPRLSDDDEL